MASSLPPSLTNLASSLPSAISLPTDLRYFEDSATPSSIRGMLESPSIPGKIKGAKWLLAMLSKGIDVSGFFNR